MHYQLSCCIVKRHYKDNMFFHISNPTLGWSACCWSLISINRLNSRSSEAIGVWICLNAWQKLQMPHIIERTEESLQAFGNAGRSTVRSPGSAAVFVSPKGKEQIRYRDPWLSTSTHWKWNKKAHFALIVMKWLPSREETNNTPRFDILIQRIWS